MTQLKIVLDKIYELINNGYDVFGCAMDMTQAFDMLRHLIIGLFLQNNDRVTTHIHNILQNIVTRQRFHFRRDPDKQQLNFGRGTLQGGTISPILFAFILDQILLEINGEDDWIYIYADDILLLARTHAQLTTLVNRVTQLLTTYGFLPNVNKYQYFTNIDHHELTIEELVVSRVDYIKYLGRYIDATGICYSKDLRSKLNKAKLAVSTIQWTKCHEMFKDSYYLFFKCCLLPILGYGCELYNDYNVKQLELLRRQMIKQLHSYKYRFPELNNQYLSMPLYRQSKLLSLNIQLQHLGISVIYCEHENKDQIKMANLERVKTLTQPNRQRASNFKSTTYLVYLATKAKLPNHLKRLLKQFLCGTIPKKQIKNWHTFCTSCNRPFKDLDHFEFTNCNQDDFLNREQIYSDLQSNDATTIFSTLKKLKEIVEVRFMATEISQ